MEKNVLMFELEQFMENNRAYLGEDRSGIIQQGIYDSGIPMDELYNIKFKSPTVGLVLSVALGLFGIDRFYSGNYIMGFLKLVTCGGCFLWYIADWKLIRTAIQQANVNKIISTIGGKTNKVKLNMNTVTQIAKSKELHTALKDLGKSLKDVTDSFGAE